MKKTLYLLIISMLLVSCAVKKPQSQNNRNSNNQKELVILSVNDMHAHIENMPNFAFVVDSLRNLYPELLVVSAGDNRTGNAYNDKYPGAPNYPMINLMNELGFDVSALGNHEFDGGVDGIRYFVKTATFPLINANAYFTGYPDVQLPDYVTITKNINGNDIKIIMVGVIETENEGKPSAHVKNLQNIDFKPAEDVIGDYLYLKDSCDVFVLLSHCGLKDELNFAEQFPQFDMIIGGHSHDLYTKTFDNGLLYTQSKSYLNFATVTKIEFEKGKIVSKEAQVIDLKKVSKVDAHVKKLVDEYYSDPEFHEVIGYAKRSFNDWDALGAYMADACRYITKTDFAMQNPGGVRFDSLHSGNLTKADIYNLDPFNNALMVVEMTGKQIEDYIDIASTKDHDCLHVSGLTYTIDYIHSDDGQTGFMNAKAYLENGEPIDPEKVYTVTINSYMALWADGRCVSIKGTDFSSNDAEILYLQDHKEVDYNNVHRYKVTKINQ